MLCCVIKLYVFQNFNSISTVIKTYRTLKCLNNLWAKNGLFWELTWYIFINSRSWIFFKCCNFEKTSKFVCNWKLGTKCTTYSFNNGRVNLYTQYSKNIAFKHILICSSGISPLRVELKYNIFNIECRG